MADESPQTTAPTVNTDLMLSLATKELEDPSYEGVETLAAFVSELCEAVDVLRRQFAAQSRYVNQLEHRLNAGAA